MPEVNETNCLNTTQPGQDIGFQLVYTTTSSPAAPTVMLNGYVSLLVPLILTAATWITWL